MNPKTRVELSSGRVAPAFHGVGSLQLVGWGASKRYGGGVSSMMPVLGWIVAVVPSEIGSPSCRRHMNKLSIVSATDRCSDILKPTT